MHILLTGKVTGYFTGYDTPVFCICQYLFLKKITGYVIGYY